VTPAKTSGLLVGELVGAPALASANRYVTTANMKVGAYTLANSAPGDSCCRNVSVTHTTVTTVDTLGTITFAGTNYNDEAITEDITPVADSAVYGSKAFKTITSITGAGWVKGGATEDTIVAGFGPKVGLSSVLDSTNSVVEVSLGTGIINAPTVTQGAAVCQNTVDGSSGTYDGTKKLRVLWLS
jgi:hypothetical protein